MKTIVSPFNMGPISKGHRLEIAEENASWYYFKDIAGIWDKALFETYEEVRTLNDGSHTYDIPISLYNEHQTFIHNFNGDNNDECDKWNDLFGPYYGGAKLYTKL